MVVERSFYNFVDVVRPAFDEIVLFRNDRVAKFDVYSSPRGDLSVEF